jgi:hypothetical protein
MHPTGAFFIVTLIQGHRRVRASHAHHGAYFSAHVPGTVGLLGLPGQTGIGIKGGWPNLLEILR